MVELALALGITLNLILTELVGLGSAGLVVPGYLALYLNQPSRVLATLAVALATWGLVRYGFMRVAVLYGRRRFGVTVLTGFLLNALAARLVGEFALGPVDLRAIGYLVPGLIANTALTQGVWPTLGLTIGAAALVRLALVAIMGWTA
jgi:poly-gamma-glutamate biosynthesis protein PgsC/CapC